MRLCVKVMLSKSGRILSKSWRIEVLSSLILERHLPIHIVDIRVIDIPTTSAIRKVLGAIN